MPQHDMILANQAGAAFRADVNDALAALVANSSGATEPATMYAYMFWADTTSGLLKQRNAANNAWITIGTLASIGLGLLSRAGGSMTGLLNLAASTDIASAATVDLTAATGNISRITGTTAVSAWTMNAGQWHMVIADGALPLTYHATANKLNTGANYTCAAGDRVLLVKDNSGIVQAEVLNSGRFKMIGPVSASGTSVDFTDIPPWVKGIAVLFSGLSTNGTQNIYARIGDSGGFETTGYNGSANNYNGSGLTNLASSFLFVTSNVAAQTLHGSLTLSLMDPATHLWNGVCQTGRSDAAGYYQSAGSKALSAALDRVQIGAGGDTFDGGTVTLICWG